MGRSEQLLSDIRYLIDAFYQRYKLDKAQAQLIIGTIPPTTEGKDGDLYLDTTTLILYLNTGGVWNPIAQLGNIDTLAELLDVTLTTPTLNDKLSYDGIEWVNTLVGHLKQITNIKTIPSNSQLIIREELIIDEELIVDGDLYIEL